MCAMRSLHAIVQPALRCTSVQYSMPKLSISITRCSVGAYVLLQAASSSWGVYEGFSVVLPNCESYVPPGASLDVLSYSFWAPTFSSYTSKTLNTGMHRLHLDRIASHQERIQPSSRTASPTPDTVSHSIGVNGQRNRIAPRI